MGILHDDLQECVKLDSYTTPVRKNPFVRTSPEIQTSPESKYFVGAPPRHRGAYHIRR